jgi:hypothetical protein
MTALSVAPTEGHRVTPAHSRDGLKAALGDGYRVVRHYDGTLVVGHRETNAALTIQTHGDEPLEVFEDLARQAREALAPLILKSRQERGRWRQARRRRR